MPNLRTRLAPKRKDQRYPVLLRVRTEGDLKARLAVIADRYRKDSSAYIREQLWQIVEREETAARKSA